jgi:hopanoid biosynthesis associated protein HpnK
MKTITTTADDFGLTPSVNAAVERAHREGCLHAASLMVAAPAADEAVRIAKANPALNVGLHLVVIEGPSIQPPSQIPDLVDSAGQFPSDQLKLGIDYFFRPSIRRQLESEIEAQFAAFAKTGLPLDHVNAHKHMHLHPTVGAMLLRIGKRYGLRRIRVPVEPTATMQACGETPGLGAKTLNLWTNLLRHQAKSAGVMTNDHCFGLAWTGHMTPEKVRRLLDHLPSADNEIYFHPATTRDETLTRLMPTYEHEAELAALLDPAIVAKVAKHRP